MTLSVSHCRNGLKIAHKKPCKETKLFGIVVVIQR